MLSTLVSASRQKKLEQLQKIVELEEYVKLKKSAGNKYKISCKSILNRLALAHNHNSNCPIDAQIEEVKAHQYRGERTLLYKKDR